MASRSITCMTLALLLCGAALQSARAAEPGEAIRVGAVLPFSGGVELYGQQAKLGLDLAARDINAAGGILGRPVEVIYVDDKTRPGSAAEAMRSLVEKQNVLATVGPITSQNLNALVPIAESSKTPLLYATNYEGGKCSRYLFSFGAVPNQELGQLLPYMSRTFGNTYFLLGADRVWPHQMFGIAQPLIEKLGGKVVATKYTLGTEHDFSPLIGEIAASKAKVLLFALKGDGMDFIRQADEAGLLKEITVAFLGLSEVDLGIFRGKGQNMVTVVPAVAASEDPAVKAFVAKARAVAEPGVAVSNYVMTHYNTLIALKAAAEKAGKLDKEAIIDAMAGLAVPSPTGPVTLGQHHHAAMSMFIARTQGSELVQVRPLGKIAPEPGCSPAGR
ncbi:MULTISPECIES: substrate-binding protein [Bradyrhizobium]|jgi:urea transport system substrate-binding protein|uniref:substrate-binding protein n=1 Tax=Bradyrhizobium TaxID=374 RepID=UPI00048A162B|nr:MULTISPECIES: substrate-binding protein [Bradyrhizobium]MCS3448884.1 branched-chain amino acid transport system substrate-binding protein/urea transport system substrate-binding protein [Bradyrhizobium elkanii]MCS3559973.1 branched-chain amino acid transport system substrate-binding protein/urea transport system substrate-binding protein [Bradyrhizobium elkanii]MCW2150181.1 branched-chain amino acid transport system substrate-binding protein/urea transport system substrate-binding protein [Br